MTNHTPRRWAAGAALAAFLLPAVGGCGGTGESIDSATVRIPEPVSGAAVANTAAAPAAEGSTGAATAETKPGPAAETSKSAAEPTAATKAEGWGTLKGRVVYGGETPKTIMLVKQGDTTVKDGVVNGKPVCSAEGIPSEKLIVDPASKGIRYAIVYIARPTAVNPEAKSAAQGAPLVFDQVNCRFVPHVLAGMKGQKVTVKSSDPVGHNINIKLINTKQNVTIQPAQPPTVIDLKAAETRPGEVVCDIHGWMKAYWMVFDTPYFAVTDEKGNFEIKNVPAGTQKVTVWAEAAKGGFVTASGSGEPIDIKADGETTKDFTLDPAKTLPAS